MTDAQKRAKIVASYKTEEEKKQARDSLKPLSGAALQQVWNAFTASEQVKDSALKQAAVMQSQGQAVRQAMSARTAAQGKSKSKSKSKPKSGRALAKSSRKSKPVTVQTTRRGGRGRNPAIAKNKSVLIKSIIKLRAVPQEKRDAEQKKLSKLTRAGLQSIVNNQYAKSKSIRGGGTGTRAAMRKSRPGAMGDYNRIRKLLKSGAIKPVMAWGKPLLGVEDVQLSDTAARHKFFREKYAPVLKQAGLKSGPGNMGKLKKSVKKSKSGGRKSVSARYQAIKQQGKVPYYLAKGTVRRIGGGPGGPGVVRVVPGSKAPAFNTLPEAEQRRVLAYLNSEKGKSLRGPGASRKVDTQGILNLKKAEAQAAAKRKKAAAQAAAKRKARAA